MIKSCMFGEIGENPMRARRRKINNVTPYFKLQLEEKSLGENLEKAV